VRGAWHPCHRKETRESRKETQKIASPSSVNSVSSVVKKTHLKTNPARQSSGFSPSCDTRASGDFHPSPPTPLPFQGRGGPLPYTQPTTHNKQHTNSIRVHPGQKNTPAFVSIRGSTPPTHSCPFVVQPHPRIRVHSWFNPTHAFVSIRGSKPAPPSVAPKTLCPRRPPGRYASQ